MKHFILASHGHFAQGIYESVKIILGEQPNVHVICGYVDGNMDVKESISNVMKQIPKEDSIIACSDLMGGSVNNELMSYTVNDNFHLITGIHHALSEVENSIQYCNLQSTHDEDDF